MPQTVQTHRKRRDPGRESRGDRTTTLHGGAWGSSSQDFLRLATTIFHLSARYAEETDGNCSLCTLAGIPMLFSAMRCLLIELNAGLYGTASNQDVLKELQGRNFDSVVVVRSYRLPSVLRKRLHLLTQVRHEIIHPAHRPGRDRNNTPAYLKTLRRQSLLQSTERASDYIWIEQLKSHRLFRWGFETMALTARAVLAHHTISDLALEGLTVSWSRFRGNAT